MNVRGTHHAQHFKTRHSNLGLKTMQNWLVETKENLYAQKTLQQLKRLAKRHGIRTNQRKADLVKALANI